MSKRALFLILLIVVMIALVAVACGAPPTPQSGVQTPILGATALPAGSIKLTGAGATFPLPLYTQWNFAYKFADPSTAVNYQGIGSGGGKKAIVDGTVDFAGSDSLLTDAEYKAGADKGLTLQMFPTVASAVVPIVNIPEIAKTLTIDGPTLADIYLGKITKWNDPAIVKLNPDFTMPDKPITAVHRSDGSGTTEIFTKYLSKVSDEWKNGPGGASSIEWPVDKAGNGVGGKGNPGVAASVLAAPYSIGYVELSFARQNNIPFFDMVNASGNKVTANADSLASAITDFGDQFSDKLTIDSISNGPGAKTWPISGYTYMIIPMNMKADPMFGCVKAQKFLDYVYWFNTNADAAAQASSLGYAVLPNTVRAKIFSTLAKVQCDGTPVPNHFAGS
ncbi:MAG TPA: phosphate ABC transporter substrate-binding protein PstS [Anaerolineae bacterium]|nr:phosphate ABC transporter substrate-binding protein PstS [Anaerolineae bacterium]